MRKKIEATLVEAIDEKCPQVSNINTYFDEKCTKVSNIKDYFRDASEPEIIAQLQNNIIDLNMIDKNNVTLLMYSADKGYFNLFTYLNSDPYIKKDILTNNKKTIMHFAAMGNNKDILQKLLDNTLNIEATDEYGYTPLYLAIQYRNIEGAKLLLKHGASTEAPATDIFGYTYLHYAAQYGELEIVKLLIESGANIEAKNTELETPLHLAAKHFRLEIVKLLIENNASIEAKTSDMSHGTTSLPLAAKNSRLEIIKFLIESRANIDAANVDGCTPLHLAACYGDLEVVKLLLENNASIKATDISGSTPLDLAIRQGHLEVIKLFINNGDKITDLFSKTLFDVRINLQNKISALNLLFKLGFPVEPNLYLIDLNIGELDQELKNIVNDLFLVDQIKNQVKDKLLVATTVCQDLIAERLEILLTQEGFRSDYTNYKEYIKSIDEANLNLKIKQTIIKFIDKQQEDISIFATALLIDCCHVKLLPLELYARFSEKSKEIYLSMSKELGIVEIQNLFDEKLLNKLSPTEIQKIVDNFNVQVINTYFARYITSYGIDDNVNAITNLILPSATKKNITLLIKEYQEFNANSIACMYRKDINTRLQTQELEIEKLTNSNQELINKLHNLKEIVKNLIATNSTVEHTPITNSSAHRNKM